MKAPVLLLAAALSAHCGKPPADPEPAKPAAAAPAVVVRSEEKPAAAAVADPMTDAAAWRALPEADRAARASLYVAGIRGEDFAACDRGAAFLTERGEKQALAALARKLLPHNPASAWAHEAVGDVNVEREVDLALRGKENCEDAGEECFLTLKRARAKSGTAAWWVGPEEAKRVRDQIAQIEAAEKRLSTRYGQGITKWARYMRAIEVMKDHPALHGARGPYVVFVSLDSKKGAQLGDVEEQELEKGRQVLARNLDIFEVFYEGWLNELGPLLGFERYGPENSDDRTLLKAIVFTKSENYDKFNDQVAPGIGGFARAYYSNMEPRFLVTHDGGDGEDRSYTDHVQCHEATHQLVQFYTWDLSHKALGREVSWLDCYVRPAWSNEGFAEFFSSFKIQDGKHVWMQPLEGRLCDLWVLNAVVAKKKWLPWELKEFLSIRDAKQLIDAGSVRGKNQTDKAVAQSVMANLFYAKAWSFIYFLWYAEADGRPKYRAKYLEYLKREFQVQYKFNDVKKVEQAVQVGSNEFRAIMGLSTDAALKALEKEVGRVGGEVRRVPPRCSLGDQARRDAEEPRAGQVSPRAG